VGDGGFGACPFWVCSLATVTARAVSELATSAAEAQVSFLNRQHE
jgi:hypothetical protein